MLKLMDRRRACDLPSEYVYLINLPGVPKRLQTEQRGSETQTLPLNVARIMNFVANVIQGLNGFTITARISQVGIPVYSADGRLR